MFAICAACSEERVIECLKYIELLSTDRKFRDILAYGIEGKHFEYLENGTVLTTRTGTDRYATRLYQTGSFVNASVASISRDILADPNQWEKVFEEYDKKGIYSKTHGFHYRESRKESIIAALQAIFGDYQYRILIDFYLPVQDPDNNRVYQYRTLIIDSVFSVHYPDNVVIFRTQP